MNILNVVQKLTLIAFTGFLHPITTLNAASAEPSQPLLIHNDSSASLIVQLETGAEGRFSDPINIAPGATTTLKAHIMARRRNHICFQVGLADCDPFVEVTVEIPSSFRSQAPVTSCVMINHVNKEELKVRHARFFAGLSFDAFLTFHKSSIILVDDNAIKVEAVAGYDLNAENATSFFVCEGSSARSLFEHTLALHQQLLVTLKASSLSPFPSCKNRLTPCTS
jgi:hypothetical protein